VRAPGLPFGSRCGGGGSADLRAPPVATTPLLWVGSCLLRHLSLCTCVCPVALVRARMCVCLRERLLILCLPLRLHVGMLLALLGVLSNAHKLSLKRNATWALSNLCRCVSPEPALARLPACCFVAVVRRVRGAGERCMERSPTQCLVHGVCVAGASRRRISTRSVRPSPCWLECWRPRRMTRYAHVRWASCAFDGRARGPAIVFASVLAAIRCGCGLGSCRM
jgi:hypothetical protein